jgi:VIT1/CCC1 family predicted Fe2+/Mn2+ transporter
MHVNKNTDKAREAYKNKDIEASKKIHQTPQVGEQHQKEGKYLKSIIYGGLDGTLTIFAVVAGIVGARLDTILVLIIGVANLFADGLSMGIGDYLSTKAEIEYQKNERRRESWEVEHYPEGEKAEMVEIYVNRGIPRDDAEQVVSILSQNFESWIDVMMMEELGIIESDENPKKNALVTFVSFAAFGSIPMIAYIFMAIIPGASTSPAITFLAAIIMTGITLFILGAIKTKFTRGKLIRSGLGTLLIGGATALLAYFVGFGLDLLLHP